MSWNPGDVADVDKFSQMSTNEQWLKDNTPRALQTTGNQANTPSSEGLIIVSGWSGANPDHASNKLWLTVNFKGYFAAAPIVVATPVSTHDTLLNLNIYGINRIMPDANGFVAAFTNFTRSDKVTDDIPGGVYVTWMAMGPSTARFLTA